MNDLHPTPAWKAAWSRWWPWLRRLLTTAFFVLIGWLLVRQARSVDWQDVQQTLLGYSGGKVALAAGLALLAFAIYSCYDLFGRHFIKSSPTAPKTMAVAFISFAFNLNLGALVGSIGLRYRLYTRLGLSKAEIAHIVGMTVTTNWLGYLLLAGIAFAAGAVDPPFDWGISGPALRLLGCAFIGVVAAYLLLCRFSPRRYWYIRGHGLRLPGARIALLQLVTACCHWLTMASVVYVFLYPQVDYLTLLGVLLVSSIAGAVAHIPGGLGVLEAVFVALLSGELARTDILAALIAYRAVFYLMPLILALAVYLVLEVREFRKPPEDHRAPREPRDSS